MMFRKLHTTGLNKFRRAIAVFLAIAAFMSGFTFAASAASFPDVKEGDWYYDAVHSAVAKGYFVGDADGNFYPNNQLTRAQFAIVVARICGVDYQNVSGAPFKDVPTSEWFYGAVSWAYNSGIINGVSATEFRPQDPVTREQMCKMVGIALEQATGKALSAEGAKTFTDDDKISAYAKEWVAKCSAEGLITGLDTGAFDPAGNAARSHAAILSVRCSDKLAETPAPELPGEPGDYNITVSGFSLNFDVEDDYYLINPADFTNCKITGFTGFKSISVSVEQYATYYPYASTPYKLGDPLNLGYGRAKVTVAAVLPDGTVRNYMIVLTDPNGADNAYAKVRVGSEVNLRAEPSTSSKSLAKLTNNTTVYYLGTQGDWAHIQYGSLVGWIKDTAEENYIRWNWEETEMHGEYATAIAALQANHPNWTFTFVDTEKDYNAYMEEVALDRAITYVKATYGANHANYETLVQEKYAEYLPQVATYMDPRYYLNEDRIFAFLDIDTYDTSLWTGTGIEAIWDNRYALQQNPNIISKADAVRYFKNASQSLQMNPYYIACRAALESGYGKSQFARGAVAGYEGYYNFFGIQCYDSNPTVGAQYAKSRNWNTVERSIIEGANWVKDQYLDRGAVTPYFFRYSGFWNKSYMSDLTAPSSEATILKRAYTDANAKAHFIIPVYRNMT